MSEHETTDVGYGNPPKHTRFKKGKSGNPRGRPRKREDINTVLMRVLNRKVLVKGNEQKMPIRDALIWKLRELALQGDKQALALQRRISAEAGVARIEPRPVKSIMEKIDRAIEKHKANADKQGATK